MFRPFALALTGILGFSLAPAAAFAAGDCKLGILVQLPVTMQGLEPLVPVKINGSDAMFVADSGAFFSMMTPAAAAEFKLKLRAAPFNLTVKGVGGAIETQVTSVDHVTLGGFTFSKPWDFLVGGSEIGAAGILGQNILKMADVEYDLANGVIRLMRPEGSCRSTNFAYWVKDEQAYSIMEIDWATQTSLHITGVAYLNDAKISVMFDTGASTSILTLHAAARAGIKTDSPGVVAAGTTYGIGQRTVKTWVGPFQSFKIGDEEIRNTRLRIGDLGIPDVDMLIGADFFLSHRVYVASKQRKLYFSYNGGPVFNLSTSPNSTGTANSSSNPGHATNPESAAPSATSGADPAAAASEAQPNGAGEPTDAETFSRRGTAFAARRDFEHALADLTRACELSPQEPKYFFERARAYYANKQPALATVDMEQVLKLKPDDVPALMWRAERRLRDHDRAGAIADLDAADRAAPQQADIRLDLGEIYRRANQLPQAITQYSLWITAHHDDVRQGPAYNARCWARAVQGQELEQGLTDCDKALRLTHDSPASLYGRGLIRLRMGEFDRSIADLTASLKLQPGNAGALYARGIAESHRQKASAAEGDIAAATALAPHIADEFKRRGLAPEPGS
jgi:tetratricopeptide (TPR) repeat protein/predicted aspartyl protease